MSSRTLTARDRLYVALARWIDRPVLALVPSQRVLRGLFALSARLGGRMPAGTAVHRDGDGALWLRPAGVAARAPVVVYIHGGGFTLGSPRTHRALAAHVAAAAGMRAVLPRYPLAPEAPFPAAPEALRAWYRGFVAAEGPPAALAGDSAGGNLALGLAQAARDAGLPGPRALALIAPAVDLSGDIAARFAAAADGALIPPAWARRVERAYLGTAARDDPRASPLLGDLRGLPPTLVQAAPGEVLAHDARALAAALPDARLELWPGLQHVWHLRAGTTPAASAACAALGRFIAAAQGEGAR